MQSVKFICELLNLPEDRVVVGANMGDDLAKMMELLQRPELDTSDE